MSSERVVFGEGSAPSLVISATGAINGLGFSPWQLWAFLRAELTAFSASPFRGATGERITMATVRTLHPQSVGVERLVPLGARLLDEAEVTLASCAPGERLALVLCLPSRMADGGGSTWPAQRRILERELSARFAAARHAAGAPDPAIRVLPLAHASLAFALCELGLAMSRGMLDAAVILSLDTPHDPAYVESLLASKRVFDGGVIDAAIPGEGGAMLLVATDDCVRRNRWPRLAEVRAAATGREVATIDNDVPIMGLGLSRCAVAATDALEARGRMLDLWLSDVTPEPDRIHEFQLAWPRAAARRMRSDGAIEFIATQLGDLGAAVMPTAVAFAVEAFTRGAPSTELCLVTGSSPTGERGAVLVERPSR